MDKKRKHISICTPYSHPSACGIWKRAYNDIEGVDTSKNTITFYSSNIEKGTGQKLSSKGSFGSVTLRRFNVWFSLGGSSMFFFFWKQLNKDNPSLIHTHGYRHPHSLQALLFAKLNKIPIIITPHAPFKKDSRRPFYLKLIDFLYDLFIGWWELRLYDKVVLTTKWEKKYLKRLGIKEEKFEYVPNAINGEYLEDSLDEILELRSNQRLAFYMGRLDPVKRVEWVVYAAKKLNDYFFTIHGPLSGYSDFHAESTNLNIKKEKYTTEDFIEQARKHLVYIMPSIRESFGMTMLEAMSQGCIVLTTKTKGAVEIIEDGVNGIFFEDEKDLVNKLQKIIQNKYEVTSIQRNAYRTAHEYRLNKLTEKMQKIYSSML